MKQRVNRVLRRSVEYAFAHRDGQPADYVRAHAQEMSEEVMYKHIDLYVNEYSVDLGAEGRRAVELLFEKAAATGIIPTTTQHAVSRDKKKPPIYCSLAYSAFACLRIGMSGSASFQSVRKSW